MSFNNCFECLFVFQLKQMKFLQIYFQQISQKYFTRCALHTLDSPQNPLNFTNSILTYLSYSLLSQKFWPSHMYDCLRATVLINIYVYMCMYNMYLYIVSMYVWYVNMYNMFSWCLSCPIINSEADLFPTRFVVPQHFCWEHLLPPWVSASY